MLYCTKCRVLSAEGMRSCSACGSRRLRPVQKGDFVYLQRADEYTAGELCSLFQEYGIRYESLPYGKGRVISLYDMEVMPTDKALYVVYDQLEAARTLAAGREKLQEDAWQDEMPEEEEGADIRRIVSTGAAAIAFILFMMLISWLVTRIG